MSHVAVWVLSHLNVMSVTRMGKDPMAAIAFSVDGTNHEM
jgi:hypothetical protein